MGKRGDVLGGGRMTWTVTIGLAALVGCSPPEDDDLGPVVRDSTGVEVVENRAASEGVASNWTVSLNPRVRLGSHDALGPEQFELVVGAVRLSNGTIVVAERRRGELRFFDHRGDHLVTVGGIGDGPTEFQLMQSLVKVGHDSILVLDQRTAGYTVFGPDGSFIRTLRPDPVELVRRLDGEVSFGCSDARVLHDGSLLGCGAALECHTDGEKRGLWRARCHRLAHFQRNSGVVVELALAEGIENYTIWDGIVSASIVHPLFPQTRLGLGMDPPRLYLANNPAYEIEVWHLDRGLEQVIRRLDAGLGVSEEIAEQAMEMFLDRGGQYFLDQVRDFPVPDSVPAVLDLVGGPAGELWVKRQPVLPSKDVSVFDVFDMDGMYMGSVEIPHDVKVWEVGDDYLLVMRTDELDVPILEILDFDRSGRSDGGIKPVGGP